MVIKCHTVLALDMYIHTHLDETKLVILMYLQEAKQAVELMGKWEMIDVCDALELLSSLFESEEVNLYTR